MVENTHLKSSNTCIKSKLSEQRTNLHRTNQKMNTTMLPDLVLPSRINQQWLTSGIDSLCHCHDKAHYLKYPHHVEYQYNSRGFRDAEWPEDLSDTFVCLGDSFTVGVGQPQNHIWPKLLQEATGVRTLNISMDGASNEWIARRAKDIALAVKPRAMIVMWSYLHRREDPASNKNDEDRRVHHVRNDPESWLNSTDQEDLDNFLWCLEKTQSLPIPQIHFSIPHCFNSLDCLSNHATTKLQSVIRVHQKDLARDGHHFDRLTADWVVKQVINQLNL